MLGTQPVLSKQISPPDSTAATVYLKDRASFYSPRVSDTVYVRGLTSTTADEEVLQLLRHKANPVEVDLTQRHASGAVWAKYARQEDVQITIMYLHQKWHRGSCLSARFELGVGVDGRRVADSSSHNTRIRCISSVREEGKVSTKQSRHYESFNYSSDSVLVNETEFPFPSGTYLARLLFLTRRVDSKDPLLSMLTSPSLGNKYAKEISEAMAMCDAVERAFKLIYHQGTANFPNVRVFVLGDGKQPLCAASLCLNFPATWTYHSIDPLMRATDVGAYRDRFFQHNCLSQNFRIPALFPCVECTTGGDAAAGDDCTLGPVNVIIACHSHAPLKEFLSRISAPEVVVTMPCCANYCDVDEDPVICFDDFEVYSPKRRVFIYHFSAPSAEGGGDCSSGRFKRQRCNNGA